MMVGWLVVAVLASGVSLQGSGTRQQPPRDRPGSRSAAQLAADARAHYQAQRWADAAQAYEAALAAQPDLPNVRFFLANAYDNLAGARGLDHEQRAVYLQRAAEYYASAYERERDPKYRKLAAEYLVAIYGPEKLNDPERAVPIVEALIRDEPAVAVNYYVLAKLYEDGGRYEDAERTLLRARDARPADPSVYAQLGSFYNRQGDFERTMDALHSSADLDASNVRAHHTVAVFYWEKSYRDHRLRPEKQREFILKGLEAEDRALAIEPDFGDALSYKNLLLRMLGNLETDAARRAALYAEADVLRARAIELQKRRAGGGPPATATAPPPDPPPPLPHLGDAVRPLRVGGRIKVPVKVKHVAALYPPDALAANVEGVVIIEIVIDEQGMVSDARILRSVPLLDRAALDAVRQWQFTPTIVDGVAMPLAMTVTVNFAR